MGRKPKVSSKKASSAEASLTVHEIVGKARIKTVRKNQILDDDALCVRDALEAAWAEHDVVIEDGTIDLSDGHPVVVQKRGSKFRLICGFRRWEAIKDDPDVAQVTCRVLDRSADFQAVVLASRANLAHGAPPSNDEKKRAFFREYDARQKAGCQLSNMREYARQYRVAPGTPKNWLDEREAQTRGDDAEKATLAGDDTVQIGQAGLAAPKSYDHSDDNVADAALTENGPVDGAPGAADLKLAASEPAEEAPANIDAELAALELRARSVVELAGQCSLTSQHLAKVQAVIGLLSTLVQPQTGRKAKP